MRLDEIRDQPRALALLTRALETGRVAHAYAFVGPAGSGRMATALAFGAALLCERGGCGACRACAMVAGRQHPDLHVVVPTAPESNPRGARLIRIDAVRELERQATLRPAMAARRVLIIDEAERMTDATPEVFLKFLEEPPPGTTVLLVIPNVRAVPATILSRCQQVRFSPRGDSGAAAAVMEVADLVTAARDAGVATLLRKTERVDRERAEALIDAAWLYCRDLLLTRAGAPARLLTAGEKADGLRVDAAAWTDDALVAAVDACREARDALVHNNLGPRLTVEMILMRLARRDAERSSWTST